MSRTLPVTRPANSTRTSSPRWWPKRSLTDLKWSMSSMSRARTRPKRRDRSILLAAAREVAVVPGPGERVADRQPLGLGVQPDVLDGHRRLDRVRWPSPQSANYGCERAAPGSSWNGRFFAGG